MSPTSPRPLPADIGVVIPSGGRGVRVGGGVPKQFRTIAGVPMLLHSIRAFLAVPRILEVVIPLPLEFIDAPPDFLVKVLSDRVRIVAGGETRAQSVHNAVLALSNESTLVLVHDAARPCVGQEIIGKVIDVIAAGHCAIAATPVRDTLKRSGENGTVLETISRDGLWQAHTPQGFPREVLKRSYDVVGNDNETDPWTDEAGLVERAGYDVLLVEDSSTNLKVTTPDDFVMAEALMSR